MERVMLRRRARSILLVVSLFAIGGATVFYGVIGNPLDPFDDRRLDPEVWNSATPDVRARMSEDLVRHHLPEGMSESEVIALLGTPFSVEDGASHTPRHAGTRHLLYDLGHWSWRGMDAAYVYVHLDGQGRLVGAEVYGF
jgi:hypothetical protein